MPEGELAAVQSGSQTPVGCESSSSMVASLQLVLAQAQNLATQDSRARERELGLQERVRQAEADREIAQNLLEMAQRELQEFRQQRQQHQPDPETTRENRRAVETLVEAAMVGRAAEALRRRSTEKLLIGVAASERVYRSTALRNRETCHCYDASRAALAAGTPLPEAESNQTLATTVEKVLKSMSVRQPVDMDAYLIGEYDFREGEDRRLVEEAIQDGKGNTATYQILASSLCLDPRSTAEAWVRDNCPFLLVSEQQSTVAEVPATVNTPPVGHKEVVTDEDTGMLDSVLSSQLGSQTDGTEDEMPALSENSDYSS